MASPDITFLTGHRLDVYSFEGCPDCTRLKRWMDAFGVAHREVDIHEEPAAAEKLESETGKQAVPFILVDDKTWVRGYHKELPGRFDAKLLLEELKRAVE
ncbi:MAG: glutaredoxin family protein [Planctomycetes bacterium]|nr:glutaredoxin family protein [Planctomycetota bacterium]